MALLHRHTGLSVAVILMLLSTVACSRHRLPSDEALPHASVAASPPGVGAADAGTKRLPPFDAAAFQERRVERENLVRLGIAGEGIRDARVLGALRRVPRHRFVPEAVRGEAYATRPLPIGWGQTISEPYIVAFMSEAVAPKLTDRCLEVGTGSGYQAAVLAELCGTTYSIEYLPKLARFAKKNLETLGYRVSLRTGDGYRGWPEAAPFDVIVVTAAPERVPAPLLEQLAMGGRLVIPVGPEGQVQKLELFTRRAVGSDPSAFEQRSLAHVRFVPFLGDAAKP